MSGNLEIETRGSDGLFMTHSGLSLRGVAAMKMSTYLGVNIILQGLMTSQRLLEDRFGKRVKRNGQLTPGVGRAGCGH